MVFLNGNNDNDNNNNNSGELSGNLFEDPTLALNDVSFKRRRTEGGATVPGSPVSLSSETSHQEMLLELHSMKLKQEQQQSFLSNVFTSITMSPKQSPARTHHHHSSSSSSSSSSSMPRKGLYDTSSSLALDEDMFSSASSKGSNTQKSRPRKRKMAEFANTVTQFDVDHPTTTTTTTTSSSSSSSSSFHESSAKKDDPFGEAYHFLTGDSFFDTTDELQYNLAALGDETTLQFETAPLVMAQGYGSFINEDLANLPFALNFDDSSQDESASSDTHSSSTHIHDMSELKSEPSDWQTADLSSLDQVGANTQVPVYSTPEQFLGFEKVTTLFASMSFKEKVLQNYDQNDEWSTLPIINNE